MTKQLAALALAERGFLVFPVAEGAKKPPLISDWPTGATDNEIAISSWWEERPGANIAIHCRGLLVIDVDVAQGGDESLEALIDLGLDTNTLTTRTPTSGRHLFYRLPADHPGVPNSVSSIGAGLDVRSTGGYVLAPGSVINGDKYRFEADVPILDAPLGLVQELGEAAKKDRSAPVSVPDAPEMVVEHARAWLQAQGGAVEGDGGDAYTYAVACGIRDRGVSRMQAFALLQDGWNQRCSPPWSLDDLWAKVENAYRYASGTPGGKVALPEDFPLLARPGETMNPETGEIAGVPVTIHKIKQGPQRLAEFADQPRRRAGYVIKGLLQRGSYAEVYGAPGAGKTFVVLDMAYHVAAGLDWMERKVHTGAVLYVAFEGTGGLVARAQALRQKYGTEDVPLYVLPGSFNLRELAGRAELGSYLRDLPTKPSLIILDTFAHALMGGDENSAQDVSAFNRGVQTLIQHTDACVLIVHHSGKDKSRGARGSSALNAAIDTEIEVDDNRIVATKQRDVELGAPIGFKLLPVAVDQDDDGDVITSCVVEPSAWCTDRSAANAALRPNTTPRRMWDVLCEAKPNNESMGEDEWKGLCAAFLPASGDKRAFYDGRVRLKRAGLIEEREDGMYQRRMA